jgi:hypothetical protein
LILQEIAQRYESEATTADTARHGPAYSEATA